MGLSDGGRIQMKYRVFRQGTRKNPMLFPRSDEPWELVGEVEAEDWDDAIAKSCGSEPPLYNEVWYEAIVQDGEHYDPNYWKYENGEHGKPYIRR